MAVLFISRVWSAVGVEPSGGFWRYHAVFACRDRAKGRGKKVSQLQACHSFDRLRTGLNAVKNLGVGDGDSSLRKLRSE